MITRPRNILYCLDVFRIGTNTLGTYYVPEIFDFIDAEFAFFRVYPEIVIIEFVQNRSQILELYIVNDN